jgi:ubiquinone/menaquinone biosynthesis C-methylase UbiE
MDELADYVLDNRAHWDRQAPAWVEMGERAWNEEPAWGIWGIPESELSLLPVDMTGLRAIELGCGTAYVSAWMTRRGASCVGIDNSQRQLDTARRLSDEHGIELELVHGNAEDVPYADESFDFAVSEYGAAIWADPYRWIPETARLLRSGGELSFLGHHPLVMVTQEREKSDQVTRNLLYPYFGLHRVDWEEGDDKGTEFNLPISGWMRLFDESGFEVLAFHEIRSPSPGELNRFGVGAGWAYDFPSEQAWRLRKR